MTDTAAPDRRTIARQAATALLAVAAIAIVIAFDPLGSLVATIDLSWISLPALPGFLQWIHDLPGPGLLIVLAILVALGQAGRRGQDGEDGA